MTILQKYHIGKIVDGEYDKIHSRIGLLQQQLSELGLREVLWRAMLEATSSYPILCGALQRNFSEKPVGELCGLYEPVSIRVLEGKLDAQVYHIREEYGKGAKKPKSIVISTHLANEANLSEGSKITVVDILKIGKYHKMDPIFQRFKEEYMKNRTG